MRYGIGDVKELEAATDSRIQRFRADHVGSCSILGSTNLKGIVAIVG